MSKAFLSSLVASGPLDHFKNHTCLHFRSQMADHDEMVFQAWPLCDMACGRPLAFVEDLRKAIALDHKGAKAGVILDELGLVGEACSCCRRILLSARDNQNRELLDAFWTKTPDGFSPERADQENALKQQKIFRERLTTTVEPIDPRSFWRSAGFDNAAQSGSKVEKRDSQHLVKAFAARAAKPLDSSSKMDFAEDAALDTTVMDQLKADMDVGQDNKKQ
jgi:DNA-directed RNA polymerase subunit N (RpoN/RPB10)